MTSSSSSSSASWLDGLTQITGQITSFTKEMIEDRSLNIDKNEEKPKLLGPVLEHLDEYQASRNEDTHNQRADAIHAQNVAQKPRKAEDTRIHDVKKGDIENLQSTGAILDDKLQHLEKVNEKLIIDLELTHAADKEKARQLHDLQREYQAITDDRNKVLTEKNKILEEKKDLLEQLDSISNEHRNLSQQFNEHRQKTNTKEDVSREKIDECASSAPTTSLESDDSQSNIVKTLTDQLADCQNHIQQFEMVRSDWHMEKQALEDVLLKLRKQLKEKEDISRIYKEQARTDIAEKKLDLNDKISNISKDDDMLSTPEDQDDETSTSNISKHTESDTNTLLMRNNALCEEKETFHKQIKDKDDIISNLTAQLKTSQQREEEQSSLPTQEHVDQLNTTVADLKATNESLSEEKDSLLASIEELDGQHEVAMNQVILMRDALTSENESLQQKVSELQQKQDEMNLMSTSKQTDQGSLLSEDDVYIQLKQIIEEYNEKVLRPDMQKAQAETAMKNLMVSLHQCIQEAHREDAQHHQPRSTESSEPNVEVQHTGDSEKPKSKCTNGDSIHDRHSIKEIVSDFEKLKEQSTNERNLDKPDEIKIDNRTYKHDEIKMIIAQKDNIISELTDKNSSLTMMLEKYSQVTDKDVLVKMNHLEEQLHNLKIEKDQIMTVLNEKSRESSALKIEVHHLMNVVSAEKMALFKLQEDNNDLHKAKEKDTNMDTPHEDMTKEAIHKLSQIIRDKDMEIEALNQKNQTLLEVLQQNSDQGQMISEVIIDRDNMDKELKVFKNDRESMIKALNAKHKESLAYHDEVQRLGNLINTVQMKYEKTQIEYTSLNQQFDDKQQAFLKMQKQMLDYKQKYAELNEKLKEVQKIDGVHPSAIDEKHFVSNQVQNSLSKNQDGLSSQVSEISNVQSSQYSEQAQQRSLEDEWSIKQRNLEILIQEKDQVISELKIKLCRTEEVIRSKESEASSAKKHSENLTFQLKGLQTELTDLQMDRNQLSERHSILLQEIDKLKEENNRLTFVIKDKEFEINASKEKANSLSKLVEKDGEQSEMNEMMKDFDEIHSQTKAMRQERDQSMLALQHQQTENQHLRQEIQRQQEKNLKLQKELERLRGHLLNIEENYTEEALAFEQREKELRHELAKAEEKISCSNSAALSENQQVSQQIENLQIQLSNVIAQRDSAIVQLSVAHETAKQYAASLQNLQMVLEQFQMEKEMQQTTEVERWQSEAESQRNENHNLLQQVYELEVQVTETKDALAAAQRLSDQLDRKEQMIAALREEVQLRESELKKSEDNIRLLSVSREARVDKELMRNLLLGYFHTPSAKRKEALVLIGRVLDFSKGDMDELGARETQGWLKGFFKKSAQTPPTTPKHGSPNKSFSELFVSFLERESSPQQKIPLPANLLTFRAQDAKHSSARLPEYKPPAPGDPPVIINPFSVPVTADVPKDIDIVSNNHTSTTITQALPMFSAKVYSQNPSSNSGTILRDVLQQ